MNETRLPLSDQQQTLKYRAKSGRNPAIIDSISPEKISVIEKTVVQFEFDSKHMPCITEHGCCCTTFPDHPGM
jgi:hypothetical protein